MEFDKFKHMETYINELDELDKVRYLEYISQNILKDTINLHINDIIQIGDTVQKVEITCAKIKKIILDTEINGACCEKCGNKVPNMLLKHMLVGMNKECPHNQFEYCNDEEYNKLLNGNK